MAKAKDDSAEKALHIRCVFQPATKRRLHPHARLLRRAQNRIPTAVPKYHSIFGIADKDETADITPREIRAHVEFPRVSRRLDRFGNSKQPQFVAELRIAIPANEYCRSCSFAFSFQLNRFELKQKTREPTRCHLWFSNDRPAHGHNSWAFA